MQDIAYIVISCVLYPPQNRYIYIYVKLGKILDDTAFTLKILATGFVTFVHFVLFTDRSSLHS